MNPVAVASLKRHEGFRSKPYRCTAGKLTIGYGLNLEEGITETEAAFLLGSRVEQAEKDAKTFLPEFNALNEVRQGALINFAYNLGLTKMLTFKRFRKNLQRAIETNEVADWHKCADELLDSRWAAQVGYRSGEIATAFATGKLPREWEKYLPSAAPAA